MYKDYWKLKEFPFENIPDSRYFFASRAHQEAITRLLFCIESHKMLAVLTGEYGSGKTVVCQTVINRLPTNVHKVAMLLNPRMDSVDLTREIVAQLGEPVASTSKYDVLRAFKAVLDRHAQSGHHCTVFIDEAQLVMNAETLEDLRLLLNFQSPDQASFSMVFSGQSEFNDMLKSIPQMKQRVCLKFHISNLEPDEVQPYIEHRLTAAGGQAGLFETDAMEEIARISKGNPREINVLCDLCLLFGFMTHAGKIGVDLVAEAQKERA